MYILYLQNSIEHIFYTETFPGAWTLFFQLQLSDLPSSSSFMVSPNTVEVLLVVSFSLRGPSGVVDLERVLAEYSPSSGFYNAELRVADPADLLVEDLRL